ncbi:MAG: CotH kinase family protein [Bdellovibrio sp.]|nr:CotH kinase family protein [Bdellovibrio sp.]
MKNKIHFKSVLLTLSVIFATSFGAQAMVNGKGTLRIDIQMPEQEQKDLLRSERTDVPAAQAKIYKDGELTQETEINLHSRGQSSLKEYDRKNMEAKSNSEDDKNKKLHTGSVKAKEMILSASPEDYLVTKNMLVYRLYKAVNVPTMNTEYAEVTINGKSQGLYMTSSSAAEHLILEEDAEVVFRRRYADFIELKKAKKSLSEADIKAYESKLADLYKIATTQKGEELVAGLSKNFNVDHYLRWLAVNYIVKNSDYFDEVFFFAKKDKNNEMQFDIFPWDLDDTFAEQMHGMGLPGYINRHQEGRSQRQMLYSFESQLDQAVSQDRVLLTKYFNVLKEVVAELSDDKVDHIFGTVKNKLIPYLADADILNGGLIDIQKSVHDPVSVLADMEIKRDLVKSRLAEMRAELAVIATENPGERAKSFSKFRKKISRIEQKIMRQMSQ